MPVIHILNIKALAATYGMTFDPFPLPETGSEGMYFENEPARQKIVFAAALLFYILICAFARALFQKNLSPSSKDSKS
jgi:hypothetical protein